MQNSRDAFIFRPSINAIVFDLDGTVWDATSAVAAGWSHVVAQANLPVEITADKIRSVAGLPYEQCVETLLPGLSRSHPHLLPELEKAEHETVLKHGGTLYPGVAEGLARLRKNFRLFIVSNCQEWYLKAFLKHSKLEMYFEDALCIGQTGLPKTKNIQEILRKAGTSRALYVGDTHWDQQAAFYAGVKFIFASYGFGYVKTAQCPSVASFSQLVEWMMAPQAETPQIEIRKLHSREFETARLFYQSVDYVQTLDPESLYYGAFHDGRMVGLVRNAFENQTWVLRGMQVLPAYQFLGIGSRLIKALEADLGAEDCYCLPHGWLEKFYGKIGFRTVQDHLGVPEFLKARLQENLKKYPQMILMKRAKA